MHDKITKAIVALTMDFPIYGQLIHDLAPREYDKIDGIGYSASELLYSPKIDKYTQEEVNYMVLFTGVQMLNGHHKRMDCKEPFKFMIASNIVIHELVGELLENEAHTSTYTRPKMVIVETTGRYKNKTVEEVYEDLLDKNIEKMFLN